MRVLDCYNFYETIEKFYKLKTQINNFSFESFRDAYNSGCASERRNIVYMLRSERKVPRLKGESDILYIGQTEKSFRERYSRYAKHHATSPANKFKYEHILKTYGSISIWVSDYSRYGETLLMAEGQLLWWYFKNHCEYPPVNYTQTKVRNNEVCFDDASIR